jgi:predicted ATPase
VNGEIEKDYFSSTREELAEMGFEIHALAGLDSQAVSEIVCKIVGGEAKTVKKALLEAISSRTNGIPLYVETVVNNLVKEAVVQVIGGEVIPVGNVAAESINKFFSNDFAGALQVLVDKLPMDAQEILRAASVLGLNVNLEQVKEVLPEDKSVKGKSLDYYYHIADTVLKDFFVPVVKEDYEEDYASTHINEQEALREYRFKNG